MSVRGWVLVPCSSNQLVIAAMTLETVLNEEAGIANSAEDTACQGKTMGGKTSKELGDPLVH